MKCIKCDYYKTGYLYNACALLEMECYMPLNDCNDVNDDGTVNYDGEYSQDKEE